MANILVFNYVIPYPLHLNGNTMRVLPLSCELAEKHRCFLVAFGEKDDRYHRLEEMRIYENISVIPPPVGQRSLLRHFYLWTGDRTRVALPKEYRRIVGFLRRIVEEWCIHLIIVHTPGLTEYVMPFSGLPKVMDAIDCNTLTLERKWEHEKEKKGWIGGLKARLALNRKFHLERGLTNIFDFVTVVSRVDRNYLRAICPSGRERIIDIPNGVNFGLLAKQRPKNNEIPDSIAFWGALDFPPNTTAVYFFYDKVFLPYLAEKDITWFIIGKNPSEKMRQMAERHSNIRLTGYIENLFELVSRIPIMVNPMQIGSGLKNKVLEAFALERLVISNAFGMEAISAEKGIHYTNVETPQEFANAVLIYSTDGEARKRIGRKARSLVEARYTWEKIGGRYLELVDGLLQNTGKRTSCHAA